MTSHIPYQIQKSPVIEILPSVSARYGEKLELPHDDFVRRGLKNKLDAASIGEGEALQLLRLSKEQAQILYYMLFNEMMTLSHESTESNFTRPEVVAVTELARPFGVHLRLINIDGAIWWDQDEL